MPLFDLPLDQLRNYTSTAVAPADFDDFWDRTIAEARGLPLNAVFEPVDNYLSVINTFDVTFSGFGGDRIKGWLHLPAQLNPAERLPVVVEYIGYSGGAAWSTRTPVGPRPATRTSSWTRADKATAGFPATLRIRTRRPVASTMQGS
jgi:cephalosporin-C deacetylase-like acetyl esterase